MDGREVAHRLMRAQRLVGTPPPDPVAVVGHLGGVQAQEFPYALWGVAQRTAGFDRLDLDVITGLTAQQRTALDGEVARDNGGHLIAGRCPRPRPPQCGA